MNVLKDSVIGIDIPIQGYQKLIYNKLKALWSLTDNSFNMYGRAYRNNTKDGYSPEVYIGNNEYQEVLPDDRLSVLGFFGVGENIQANVANYVADVSLILMVDLSKVKPLNNRQDEEVRNDVHRICQQRLLGFTLEGLQMGIDNVFKEYSGFSKDNIKFMDQHPWHCFRIDFKLLYDINKN